MLRGPGFPLRLIKVDWYPTTDVLATNFGIKNVHGYPRIAARFTRGIE